MKIASEIKPQPIPTNKKFVNLTGKRFGQYRVIFFAGERRGNRIWLCKCDCGNIRIVGGAGLVWGTSKSCGHNRAELMSKTMKRHGRSETPEYYVWLTMIQRCRNKNHKQFKDYGDRGIKVCERWKRFENFLSDMGERPSKNYSIDRHPNNNGDYEPGNCRWATRVEQCNNRRSSHFVSINGNKKTIAQWSLETGIPVQNIHARIRLGWDIKKCLFQPVHKVPARVVE